MTPTSLKVLSTEKHVKSTQKPSSVGQYPVALSNKDRRVRSILLVGPAGRPPDTTLSIGRKGVIDLDPGEVGIMVTYLVGDCYLIPYSNIRHVEYA